MDAEYIDRETSRVAGGHELDRRLSPRPVLSVCAKPDVRRRRRRGGFRSDDAVRVSNTVFEARERRLGG